MERKKIIFLSMISFTHDELSMNSIYPSLLNKFVDNNCDVYILNPIERKDYKHYYKKLENVNGINVVNIKIGNIRSKDKFIKGISLIDLDRRYLKGIKKYLSNISFDLILYPTPPITLYNVVKYLKKKNSAITYLMLKDIFPQNAVDLGFFSKRSLIYKYFRNREVKLYEISDYIGCMSRANVDYLLNYNPNLNPEKVEILPNSIDPIDISVTEDEKKAIRDKYNLPLDKKIFIYGGNLGKPQGIPFLLKCIESVKDNDEILFLIIGSGTEFNYIVDTKEKRFLDNLIVMGRLDKDDFNNVLAASDIGIISLDHRFTIPNYPSRLLSYMQAKLPVLAITDNSSDIGSDIIKNNFGRWCVNNSIHEFRNNIKSIIIDFKEYNILEKKMNAYEYLKDNFDSEKSKKCIISKLE